LPVKGGMMEHSVLRGCVLAVMTATSLAAEAGGRRGRTEFVDLSPLFLLDEALVRFEDYLLRSMADGQLVGSERPTQEEVNKFQGEVADTIGLCNSSIGITTSKISEIRRRASLAKSVVAGVSGGLTTLGAAVSGATAFGEDNEKLSQGFGLATAGVALIGSIVTPIIEPDAKTLADLEQGLDAVKVELTGVENVFKATEWTKNWDNFNLLRQKVIMLNGRCKNLN
jgi:hypothetical protein